MEQNPRIALVTGGSNGIGSAIAARLASGGFRVVIADIEPPHDTQENIIFQYCDVTSGADVDSLYNMVTQTVGTPTIVVINAGRGIHELLAEGDPEKWQQVVDLNIMGALRCIRSFVPLLLSNKKGDVVFISSVSSTKPYTYGAVYGATKAALDNIAETLRLETAPHLRVTVVRAGITDTDFFRKTGRGDDIGNSALEAKDIAEDVWYAINKPKGTAINAIVTRPHGQEF